MNTTEAKARLNDELAVLESQLSELGPRNAETGIWETSAGDIDTSATEADEIADRVEETESRQEEHAVLSARREDILSALAAIENGTYGTCTVCAQAIEPERLMANAAARTCSAHA